MGDNLYRALLFCKIALAFTFLSVLQTPAVARDSALNKMQTPLARHLTMEALEDMQVGRWDAARAKVARSKDPLASKLFNWMLLLHIHKKDWTSGLFIRLTHFIRLNPEWPEIEAMKVRAEGIMPEDIPSEDVLAWYKDFPPQTSYGMGRYADALIAQGNEEKAREIIREWWGNVKIPSSQQKKIYKEYKSFLSVEAHKRRFDALLYDKQYNAAMDMANVLGEGYADLARARIALAKNRGSGIGKLIDKVPDFLQNDPGLLFERLRWRRKRNLNKGALEILDTAPPQAEVQNPEQWWQERHIMIRRLMEHGKYDQAYDLAVRHIQRDGASYAQAQWLAGWLALRFINKPTEAYERFSVLYTKVSTPISKGRAAYWAGRAADELGDKNLARRWYKNAAEFQTVFYGQLAGYVLSMEEKLPQTKLPYLSSHDRKRYDRSELVQAAQLFDELGMQKKSEQFLGAFLEENEVPKAYRYAAEVTASKGDYHGAVKIAKKATQKGLFLTKQSYPTITKHLNGIDAAEWALIHAIIRQESAFDYEARSHAGALGLMQLLPSTAREVSRKAGLSYKKRWLTEKPQYNIQLGSLYIGRLISYYEGSYPLAIAAYNAGPGRVDSWLKTYGDPRRGDVNLIDWIELIPIYETRNYVQRVMEGLYIYRLRLQDIQKQPKEHLHVAFQ